MTPRLKILLVASLVLNVFLLGSAAGVMLMRQRLVEFAAPRAEGPAFRGVSALEPEQRQAFRRLMRERMDEIRPRAREAHAARRAVREALAQPTFAPPSPPQWRARGRPRTGPARPSRRRPWISPRP
jgi:uncharacterized membrane protein